MDATFPLQNKTKCPLVEILFHLLSLYPKDHAGFGIRKIFGVGFLSNFYTYSEKIKDGSL